MYFEGRWLHDYQNKHSRPNLKQYLHFWLHFDWTIEKIFGLFAEIREDSCFSFHYRRGESVSDFFFKSVNIWQSYKQERDCLVHFLCLLAVATCANLIFYSDSAINLT